MASCSVSRSSLVWFAAVVLALLAVAPAGHAEPQAFRNGQLTIELFSLDPVNVPPSAPLASGVLEATRTETGITTIGFPTKVFETTGLSIPITDPNADPIDGIFISVFNPAATFKAAGGSNGGFGGKMPLQGTTKVCLIGGQTFCQNPAVNLTLPLSVVGQTATTVVTFLANITVKGAPWTTGVVKVPNNKVPPDDGFTTVTGGIEQTTAGDGSFLAVKLVTPIYISTAIGGSEVVPAWGVVSFEVPEPDVMALGLGAVGALVLVGLRRRYA